MNAREIIDETREFYAQDPTRRAYQKDLHRCSYHDPTSGNRCAVGRCLTEDAIVKFGDVEGDVSDLRIEAGVDDINDLLKPEYQGQSEDFWQSLQFWHDVPDNWTADGMSTAGEQTLKFLKERIL